MRSGAGGFRLDLKDCVEATDALLRILASVSSRAELACFMEAVTQEFGFQHFALIDHDDLRGQPPGRVDIRRYPAAACERIIEQATWRRDPIIRGCIFAPTAFLWSRLPSIIQFDRRDRDCMEQGLREGLNEGISVPYITFGACMGSCTFAGTRCPERAARMIGMVQVVGTFAFQAAKRMIGAVPAPAARPRLHPRPRDCIVLAGRGLSNKEIARALGLTPRTVDGYLTEARYLFDAHDRTELVVAAVLAGEIGLHELRVAQPG